MKCKRFVIVRRHDPWDYDYLEKFSSDGDFVFSSRMDARPFTVMEIATAMKWCKIHSPRTEFFAIVINLEIEDDEF